jgi:hypothetical protein
VSGELVPFPLRARKISTDDALHAAERVLATPIEERTSRRSELALEDPEMLLAVCDLLRARGAIRAFPRDNPAWPSAASGSCWS